MRHGLTLAIAVELVLMAPGGNAVAQTVWTHTIIASTNDVGQYASLALEPITQKPFIAYRDNTNIGLRLAHPVASGGNCGPGNKWRCEFPSFWEITSGDSGARDPEWISTAFHPGCGIHPSVSFVQGPAFGSGLLALAWGCTAQDVVPYGDNQPATGITNTSLSFSDSGEAVLAYHVVASPSSSSLWWARQSGSTFNSAEVSSGSGIGDGSSGAAAGVIAVIAYKSSFGELWTALGLLPVGLGDCGPFNTWQCLKIDDATSVLATAHLHGAYNGKGHIAYIVPTGGGASLKYATTVGTGGNCGGGAWSCITIEDVGTDVTQAVSIAVDDADGPVIAYHDKDDGNGNGVLKVARPQSFGNCGPKLLNVFTWDCTTVDDGAGVRNVGRYLSIALTSTNLARVAYYDASDGDLLFAQENLPTPTPTVTPTPTQTNTRTGTRTRTPAPSVPVLPRQSGASHLAILALAVAALNRLVWRANRHDGTERND